MLVFECPFCTGKDRSAVERARMIVCYHCIGAAALPTGAAAMLPDASPPDRRQARRDDDDDDDGAFEDDDRPRKKRKRVSSGDDAATAAGVAAGAAAGAAGLGIGMILLIVGGLFTCCICVPGILVALMVPAINKVKVAAEKTVVINNMRQVALATHEHNGVFQSLPSPKMRSELPPNAAVQLSWRVSILRSPSMFQNNLFQQFDKNQAWDGLKNRPLLNQMPPQYLNPIKAGGNLTDTQVQYFTGPNTLFPDLLSQVKLLDITDGTSNVFLCAEARDRVPWSKPSDMVIAAQGALPLPDGTFVAAMCDASARIIDRSRANDEVLRMLIDPKDGKVLPGGWDQ